MRSPPSCLPPPSASADARPCLALGGDPRGSPIQLASSFLILGRSDSGSVVLTHSSALFGAESHLQTIGHPMPCSVSLNLAHYPFQYCLHLHVRSKKLKQVGRPSACSLV